MDTSATKLLLRFCSFSVVEQGGNGHHYNEQSGRVLVLLRHKAGGKWTGREARCGGLRIQERPIGAASNLALRFGRGWIAMFDVAKPAGLVRGVPLLRCAFSLRFPFFA